MSDPTAETAADTTAPDAASATPSPVAGGAAAAAQLAAGATSPPDGSPAAAVADQKESASAQEKSDAQKPADKADTPIDYAKAIGEVKLPEGMTLNPEAAKAGTELFARHKISAEAAKDLVSLYAQQQKAGADGNAKAFAAQVAGWKAGAEKSTTAEERGTAKDAVLKVFPQDLVSVFETFGLTNRADFIKAMGTLGKSLRDDAYVAGNAAAANGSARDARSHFPKSNMNP